MIYFILEQKLLNYKKEKPDVDTIEYQLENIKTELDSFKGVTPKDIDAVIIQKIIDKITVQPIGPRKARLHFVLNTGEYITEMLGCSGNMRLTHIAADGSVLSGCEVAVISVAEGNSKFVCHFIFKAVQCALGFGNSCFVRRIFV